MEKAVYIVAGDFYHERAPIEACIRAGVALAGGDIRPESIEFSDLKEVLLRKPGLLIISASGVINPQDANAVSWLTNELDETITEYVRAGGSLLAMHTGMASYKPESGYIKMLGGYFLMHPEVNQVVRYFSDDAGTSDIKCDFSVPDEHYFVNCDEENTQVFLRSESPDGHAPAGWRHCYGEGRVLCLTPTHRTEGLTNPDMISLLGGCVGWCLGRNQHSVISG